MCCSHLSNLKLDITENKMLLLKEYFLTLTPNTKNYITPSKIMRVLDVDYETSVKVLLKLEKAGYLERYYGVRCPECSMLIKTGDFIESLDYENISVCYSCDEEICVTNDDIVILFRLTEKQFPFNAGQQRKYYTFQNDCAFVAPEDRYALFESVEASLKILALNAKEEIDDRLKKKENEERDSECEKRAIKKYKRNTRISVILSILGYFMLVGIIIYVYGKYGFEKISIFATFGSSLIPFGINYVIIKLFPQDIDLIKRISKLDE